MGFAFNLGISVILKEKKRSFSKNLTYTVKIFKRIINHLKLHKTEIVERKSQCVKCKPTAYVFPIHQSLISICFLLKTILKLHLPIYMYVCVHISGSQRTTFGSWVSPIMQVPGIKLKLSLLVESVFTLSHLADSMCFKQTNKNILYR